MFLTEFLADEMMLRTFLAQSLVRSKLLLNHLLNATSSNHWQDDEEVCTISEFRF